MGRLYHEKDYLRWDGRVPIEDLVSSLIKFNNEVNCEGEAEIMGDILFLRGFRPATEEEIAESERELFDDDSDYFQDDPKEVEDLKDFWKERLDKWNLKEQSNTCTADAKSGLSTLLNQWEDVVDAGQNLLAGCTNYLNKLSERLENGKEGER